MGARDCPITRIDVGAYTVPTDAPEADGTFAWDKTTLVLVEAEAGGKTGLGYTYADTATATLIQETLAKKVMGREAMDVPGAWHAMDHAIRNLGRPGICSMAIAAVDVALWDLKARLLGLPLASLLGRARDGAPVYGSGGFTTYTKQQLQEQLGGWAAMGIPRVKMKVGTHPEQDLERVKWAREAIGPDVQLFVDANGAYSRKQALQLCRRVRRARRDMVRGAAPVGRSGGPAPAARPGAGGHGHRRRGVRLLAVLFPPNAGCRSGGCFAGRRLPVRRGHGVSGRRRALPRPA